MPLGARKPGVSCQLIARKSGIWPWRLPIVAGPEFPAITRSWELPLGEPANVVLRDLKWPISTTMASRTPTKEIVAAVRVPPRHSTDAGIKVEESGRRTRQKPGAFISISARRWRCGRVDSSRSVGSNEISPMFERALAVAVTPRWPTRTEALARLQRDLVPNDAALH